MINDEIQNQGQNDPLPCIVRIDNCFGDVIIFALNIIFKTMENL